MVLSSIGRGQTLDPYGSTSLYLTRVLEAYPGGLHASEAGCVAHKVQTPMSNIVGHPLLLV